MMNRRKMGAKKKTIKQVEITADAGKPDNRVCDGGLD